MSIIRHPNFYKYCQFLSTCCRYLLNIANIWQNSMRWHDEKYFNFTRWIKEKLCLQSFVAFVLFMMNIYPILKGKYFHWWIKQTAIRYFVNNIFPWIVRLTNFTERYVKKCSLILFKLNKGKWSVGKKVVLLDR